MGQLKYDFASLRIDVIDTTASHPSNVCIDEVEQTEAEAIRHPNAKWLAQGNGGRESTINYEVQVRHAITGADIKQIVPLEARLFLLDHAGHSTAKPLARISAGSVALRGAGGNHRRSLPRVHNNTGNTSNKSELYYRHVDGNCMETDKYGRAVIRLRIEKITSMSNDNKRFVVAFVPDQGLDKDAEGCSDVSQVGHPVFVMTKKNKLDAPSLGKRVLSQLSQVVKLLLESKQGRSRLKTSEHADIVGMLTKAASLMNNNPGAPKFGELPVAPSNSNPLLGLPQSTYSTSSPGVLGNLNTNTSNPVSGLSNQNNFANNSQGIHGLMLGGGGVSGDHHFQQQQHQQQQMPQGLTALPFPQRGVSSQWGVPQYPFSQPQQFTTNQRQQHNQLSSKPVSLPSPVSAAAVHTAGVSSMAGVAAQSAHQYSAYAQLNNNNNATVPEYLAGVSSAAAASSAAASSAAAAAAVMSQFNIGGPVHMPSSMPYGTNNNTGNKRSLPDDFAARDNIIKRALPDAEQIISALELYELIDVNKDGQIEVAELLQYMARNTTISGPTANTLVLSLVDKLGHDINSSSPSSGKSAASNSAKSAGYSGKKGEGAGGGLHSSLKKRQISKDSFVKFIKRRDSYLIKLFKEADADGDGSVTPVELRLAVQGKDGKFPATIVSDIVEWIDLQKVDSGTWSNHTIELNEFVEALRLVDLPLEVLFERYQKGEFQFESPSMSDASLDEFVSLL